KQSQMPVVLTQAPPTMARPSRRSASDKEKAMRGVAVARICVALALLALRPTVAAAQSTIAGLVKDSSGAVLPGVTVEAASPVLIEKTRSVVTDGDGRYSIVNLRPGTYSVVFTLTGFSTFKRDSIIVPADST